MKSLRSLFVGACYLLTSSVCLAQEGEPPYVKVLSVLSGDNSVTRQFFGKVVAKQTVDLGFQVGGQIVELPIVEGERIEKGTLLAKLDREPFEIALATADIHLQHAKRNSERFKALKGSTVSQAALEETTTQLSLSEIAVRDAKRSLENTLLAAPFNALVASRLVPKFATVAAGSPIVRLHDMSELRIEIDVPEVLIQQAGQNLDANILAKISGIDQLFPTEIREYNAETSGEGQTFKITLGMPSPEKLFVLPGSSAIVFVTIQDKSPTIKIPSSAVVTANDGSTHVVLFLEGENGEATVKLTPVEILPNLQGEVLVTSGLTSGQEFVARGANRLSDGKQVRRFRGSDF